MNMIFRKLTLFCLLLFVCSAGTQLRAQATLEWVHPSPQGNMLRAATLTAEGDLIATGNYGTVLRSADGGVSWENTMFGLTDTVGQRRQLDQCFHGSKRHSQRLFRGGCAEYLDRR